MDWLGNRFKSYARSAVRLSPYHICTCAFYPFPHYRENSITVHTYLREHRVLIRVSIVPEHTNCLQILSSVRDPVGVPGRLLQVLHAHLIHWEEPNRSTILWTHVTDGCSIRRGRMIMIYNI